jgi:dienelactone hydrolase
VVFNFHGMGDTADNMRLLLSDAVDDAAFPFILVTPEDTNFALAGMLTIDWEVATVTAENREAAMFDEILACLESRWGVDESHVHVVGFSMGGFVTDMLGTLRGEQLASTVSYSGAYGNDDANLTGLGMLTSFISWPEYTTTNRYAQVLLHGGTTDTYNAVVVTLHFDTFAANDSAFLGGLGHDTVVCNHGGGHTVPFATFGPDQIVEFFRDHPLGTSVSPYASAGLPADWPSYCAFVPATGGG